jgi:undecaprenyl-diphosphatase
LELRPSDASRRLVAALAVTAAVLLVSSWAWATVRPVPAVELDVFRWFDGAPNRLADVLGVVMQLGTLELVPLVAVLVLAVSRRAGLALAVIGAGVLGWFVANRCKELVERGRPPAYIRDVVVRDGTGRGLGYPSGHTTVAFAVATVLVLALPARWRALPLAVAAVVGIARMVVGVHLPADVVGGAGLGILCGLIASSVVAAAGRRGAGAGPVP